MGEPAILHLDMDAFYASVEQRDDPSLRGKPLVVGGDPRRGVVLAASYQVRPFGVRSAMPMARALKLCPAMVVVPPRFAAYAEASEAIHQVLNEVTPLIEPLSLDEAFLDVTGSTALFGSPWEIALRLRREIARRVELPASAGIATSKFVAKIASDLAKPDGQREVKSADTVAFLRLLPLGRLWGVGPKTEAALGKHGLRTIGDVRARGLDWLVARLGDGGRALFALSNGEDDRPVVPDRQQKQLGSEDTFSEDTLAPEALHRALHAQAWRVGQRLRRAKLRGRVVELKLKDQDFQVIHRRSTLPAPSDDGQTIYRAALALLARAAPTKPLRLTGVSVSDFGEAALDLFTKAAGNERREALNRAIDRIADKFGPDRVRPADLLEPAEGPVLRVPLGSVK